MYSLLHNLLADRKGGKIFTLFGAWHFFYIALAVLAIVVLDQEKSFGIEKVFINGKLVYSDGRLDEDALKKSGRAIPVFGER